MLIAARVCIKWQIFCCQKPFQLPFDALFNKEHALFNLLINSTCICLHFSRSKTQVKKYLCTKGASTNLKGFLAKDKVFKKYKARYEECCLLDHKIYSFPSKLNWFANVIYVYLHWLHFILFVTKGSNITLWNLCKYIYILISNPLSMK